MAPSPEQELCLDSKFWESKIIGRMRISEIVRGQRAITAETAILLSRVLAPVYVLD